MMVRGGTGPEERTGAGDGWRDEEEKLERDGEGGDQVGEVSGGGGGEEEARYGKQSTSAGDRGDVGRTKFSRPGSPDFSRSNFLACNFCANSYCSVRFERKNGVFDFWPLAAAASSQLVGA